MRRFKALPKRKRNELPTKRRNQLPKYAHGHERVTGRALQRRRKELWAKDPHCAGCGRVVAYPHGFELDHTIPLHLGGTDTPDNWQLLCVHWEGDSKLGCHNEKTVEEHKALGKAYTPTRYR